MEDQRPRAGARGREPRLLLVTLGLSVLFLVVLARFRFPESGQAQQTAAVAAQPLARLAAQATYDDLASIMDEVERRTGPSTLVLDTVLSEGADIGGEAAVARSRPALRIRDDMVLVALEAGEQVVGVAGQNGGPIDVLGRDEVRGLAVVRVPVQPAPTLSVETMPPTGSSPRYVAMVEASRGGPAVRPVYVGRLDPVSDPRWREPLTSLGGLLTAQAGTFVFTLAGKFVGLVVAPSGLPALVPAGVVLTTAQRLAEGRSRRRGDLGIVWQALTPAIARAAAASDGVVVGDVRASGPAHHVLLPGDVVTRLNGWPLHSVPDAWVASSGVGAGEPASLQIVRQRETTAVEVVAGEPLDPSVAPSTSPSADLGLTVRARPAGLQVVRVAAGTAGEAGGLVAGDLITSINQEPVTSASLLTAAWTDAPAGTAWLLVVERRGTSMVLALEKP